MRKRWLTAEEEALLSAYRHRWLDIGFGTGPADKQAAEQAIASIYRGAHLDIPHIVWCASPLSMMVTAALVLSPHAFKIWFLGVHGEPMRERVHLSMRDAVESSLECSIAKARRERTWKPFEGLVDKAPWATAARPFRQAARASLSAALSPRVEDWVVESARGSLDLGPTFQSARRWLREAALDAFRFSPDEVRKLIGLQPYKRVESLHAAALELRTEVARIAPRTELVHGQHNADWVGLCDYLHDVCGPRRGAAVQSTYGRLAMSAGWVLPRARVCFVCERPSNVVRDEMGRLHSTTGPAIVYPDGWGACFWRGVQVRRGWLERGVRIPPEFVVARRPEEQRRALVEIAGGWESLLSDTWLHVLDKDEDPAIGTLVEWATHTNSSRFLKVVCGTGRTFMLPVPVTCRTAREANAWTYGLMPAEYNLEVRT